MKKSHIIFIIMLLCLFYKVEALPIYSYDNSYNVIYLQEERTFSQYLLPDNFTMSDSKISFMIEKIKDTSEEHDFLIIPVSLYTSVRFDSNIETQIIDNEITNEQFNIIRFKLPVLNKGEEYIGEININENYNGWGYDENNKNITINSRYIPDYVNTYLTKNDIFISDISNYNYYVYLPKERIKIISSKNEIGTLKQIESKEDNIIYWKIGSISRNASGDNKNLVISIEKDIPSYNIPIEKKDENFKEKNKIPIITVFGFFIIFGGVLIPTLKRFYFTKTKTLLYILSLVLTLVLFSIFIFSNSSVYLIIFIYFLLLITLWFTPLYDRIEFIIEKEIYKDKLKRKITENGFLSNMYENNIKSLKKAKAENKISDKTYNFEISDSEANLDDLKKRLEKLKERRTKK